MKISFVLLFILVSCADATIYSSETQNAVKLCEKNEGLDRIDIWDFKYNAYCKNKAMFTVQRNVK